jgi:metal-sulfur cluster biosynthetic enzyme|tara:strand:- start:1091 stop:1399 length:309 start_codon:yes stop_codon:yes gene_type:complete
LKNKIDYNQIIENLKQVHDPEISINVYDLGLIYDIKVEEKNAWVTITHTLTSAWCGFADEITENIRQAGYAPGVEHVEVITTFEPPFTMESVSEEVRMMMGW